MNRGEVWTITDGDHRRRVVALSSDTFVDHSGRAYCAPIARRPAGELPPFVVPLTDLDPLAGVALIGATSLIHLGTGTQRVGYLTGATMARISQALRDMFEL